MSNLDKRCAPLLSVVTMVKFETAPSLSLSPAALLVPALMFSRELPQLQSLSSGEGR